MKAVAASLFFLHVFLIEGIIIRQHEGWEGGKSERTSTSDGEAVNLSMRLSQTFEELASRLPPGTTQKLFRRLKVCTSCSNYSRLGEANDGGYLTCMDGLEGGGQLRAAYSFGVENYDKWSMDIYNLLKVPVHQFDCTVEGPAQNCADCHFHKVCLQGASGAGGHPIGPNMNMEQVVATTGQASAPDDSLIVKMDIEGAEWPIFADGDAPMNKFKQLVVEFHNLNQEARHSQYVRALESIENQSFMVSHIHGNNCCGMYNVAGMSVPNFVEVTFIKNSPPLANCQTEQQLDPLDAPNLRDSPELPMAHVS